MKWYKRLCREKSASQNKALPIKYADDNNDDLSNEDKIKDDDKAMLHYDECMINKRKSVLCSKFKSLLDENGMKIGQFCRKPVVIYEADFENVNYMQLIVELEKIISESYADITVNSSITIDHVVVDPEDFFDDPNEVFEHKFQKEIEEWDIVDGPEEDFVDISRTPSVISLRSYEEDTFGLFYTKDKAPEADYYRFFAPDIQFGRCIDKPRLKVHTKIDEEENSKKNKKDNGFDKGRQLFYASFEKDAFVRSLMGPLKHNKGFNPLFDSSFGTMCDKLNVKQYFGLNDCGNIIIHMDHISEEHGKALLMKKKYRSLFKDVPKGEEMYEGKKFRMTWCELIQTLFDFMKAQIKGHPRNKIVSGGPGELVAAYALSLASDTTSTFARNIENFISCTKESKEVAPQVVMRNMRQFMSGMKNYLVKHGEGDFAREVQKARSKLKADEFLNLDQILEGVMHRLVILPLREHLYGLFVDYYTKSGDIQLLVENVKYAANRSPADFGIRHTVTPPSAVALRQISSTLVRLQEAELPLEKLDLLLAAVSTIFEATGCPKGQQLSADDFLPLLVFVVARCGFVGAEIEAEFMWGLLQPSLLSGEAGYYLTALCSAVHVLKSFMASDTEGTGSIDWRSSSLPACSSVLRVIIPDECNGSIQTRTLPIRPHTTTREVCRIIAHKARITNAQDYALFKLVDGEETLLMDNECPQDVRMEARGKHCILAYKRIEAKIAWPTMGS